MSLRVLHVCTYDREGGAARAANRLHLAERAAGLDSHMVVAQASAAPDILIHAPLKGSRKLLYMLRRGAAGKIVSKQKTPTNPVVHSLAWLSSGLGAWIERSNFDIVNLHWVGDEMLTVEEIGRLTKPLVWTMHDMWPFMGAEHYDDLNYPGRWRMPYAAGNRPVGYRGLDLDRWVWRRKSQAWAGQRFHLVSPSNWLAECARESALLGDHPCTVIPNPINTAVFRPFDRRLAREILGLASDRRYVLFGAMSATSDSRKGFAFLQPALQALASEPSIARDTELLIFGATRPADPPDLGLPIHYLGQLQDDVALALLYNAADVFVAPSMQDNLPNTLVEAACCATPGVAFAIGGMTDLIKPGLNGALASAFDTAAFSAALAGVLSSPPAREPIRAFALARFASETVVRAYRTVYDQTLALGSRP